jgi:GNAT superfamily N-acetyltransferase
VFPQLVRPATQEDLGRVLELFDAAVVWLVARGAAGQWGREPFSSTAARRDQLAGIASRGEPRVACDDTGEIVGFSVLGDRPAYAPPVGEPERYLEALVTDRARAGEGIGSALIADAVALTRAAGVALLSTDCWAGAPRLVRWYEQHGFAAGAAFLVGAWPAQQLARRV